VLFRSILASCLITLMLCAGWTALGSRVVRAEQEPSESVTDWALKITSPLGRTGVISKVRIVAQIRLPRNPTPIHAWFYVDGKLVGEALAPPYSVDWVDENPFEKREIVVQAQDTAGRTLSDKVILPPFEITDNSDVTSVLLEAGVYDKTGRFM